MKVTKYFLPPMDSMCMGPQTSLWTSCSFSVEPTSLNCFRCILPSMHPSQNDNFAVFETFIPFTSCLLIASWRHCLPRCPNLWCHRSMSRPVQTLLTHVLKIQVHSSVGIICLPMTLCHKCFQLYC